MPASAGMTHNIPSFPRTLRSFPRTLRSFPRRRESEDVFDMSASAGMTTRIAVLLIFMFFGLALVVEAQNLTYSPEAADLYQNAMGALRMRRLNLARQQLKEVMEKYPGDVHASLARRQIAAIMRDQKEFEAAIELLNDIIAKDRSEDTVRMAREELLDILFELQRFRQGIELIEGWRKGKEQDVLLGRQLARFYLQAGRKDEAWLLLETFVETGNAPDAFKELLDLAVRTGEVEKLLNTLETRRTRYRSEVFAEYASECHIALGRKDKAITAILEAGEQLDFSLMLLRKLADLYTDTNAMENAITTHERALKILPDDWVTLRKLGHCRFVLGQKKEAIETWRRPLGGGSMPAREFFTEFTTVLIEHQLYEEALQAFEEARRMLQDPTLFSEEKATVLDAVNRPAEALEEYLHVLTAGIYKPEVFDKLYESTAPGFSLEERLLKLREQTQNPAIMQALLEFYFRRADARDIDKIETIVSEAVGGFDYAFYERLKQEALLIPTGFHFDLAEKVMNSRPESTVELMLADLLLRMAPHEDAWEARAYDNASRIVKERGVADADLKATLLLDLAKFAIEQRNDLAAAHDFIDRILQTDLLQAVPSKAVFAALLKARVLVYEEKFAAAESLLNELGKKLENPDFEAMDMGAADRQDHISLHQIESARLAMHQGDYQKALGELKKIVEDTSEGDYVNDALEMALFITRRSIGDFDLLKRSLKAERLTHAGKLTEAAGEISEAIGKNASATALVSEMQADLILLRQNASDTAELLQEIENYAKDNPAGFKTADLLELKLRLQRKSQVSEAEIRESLQTFVETFPSDLRSGRYKKILAAMHGKNSKEKKK